MRQLADADAAAAAELHQQVLGVEFVAKAGFGFLRRYYAAWMHAPGGMALATEDADGRLSGILLGALDPDLHYRSMLRRDGLALGTRLAVQALVDPSFGRLLLVTRGRRYVGAVIRVGLSYLRRRQTPSLSPGLVRSGEVTHVLVRPDLQGNGLARALLKTATEQAREAGLSSLALVTTPELASSGFYDRLGWYPAGAVTSRSQEDFVAYRLYLNGASPEMNGGR